MKKYLLHWLPVVVWMGFLFALSAQPELPLPPGPWLQNVYDKFAHAVSYAVLAWLLWRALRQRYPPSAVLWATCAGLAIAYGISDEFHQAFVPGRTPSVADLAADGVGAVAATLLLKWRARWRAQARTAPDAR